MKRFYITILFILLFLTYFSSSCTRTALRLSSSTFSNLSSSVFEECDQKLAEDSIPANLKMLEGLLKSDPSNKVILNSLSMGFCGYSMLFIEGKDPDRASEFYLRARGYGLKALGPVGITLMDFKNNDIGEALTSIGEKDLDSLFWTTMSWQLWINLNLDNPRALSQLERSEFCLDRILELNANYLYGLPYILKGVTLSARPAMLGGDMKRAKQYFEKALDLTNREFFPAQYYYARYYAVQVQDKKAFKDFINEVVTGDPNVIKDMCLINTVFQNYARELFNNIEEYFF